MAEKRRGKAKKREGDEPETPTKEEYAVAKYLRFNVPTREGKLVGMTVQYFIASKAVDAMLESKWSAIKAKSDPLFTSRASCVDYMDKLLHKGMFHRALRIERKKDREKELKKKRKIKEEVEESGKEEDKKSKKEKKSKKSKEKEEEKESETEKEEKKEEEKKEEEKKEEEKKRKKKLKLEMHDHQLFKDGEDIYVWIYDPVPVKTFIIGLLLVLGAIAVCLFPLWPPEVRLGVYYLSLAAAGFVGLILSLCVIRLILFCIVWLVTIGKHHFWFLPNLTEDVSFIDSFRPLYHHETSDQINEKKSKDKRDKKKKQEAESVEAKKSEEEKQKKGKLVEGEEKQCNKEQGEEENNEHEEAKEKEEEKSGEKEESGSENDNGYEIVDPGEVGTTDDNMESKKDK